MLAAMLGMFENQISLFPNAAFEEEDGAQVLVVQGDADKIRFSRQQNGGPTDHLTSGQCPRTTGVRTLVRNGWLELSDTGAGLRIKLGERARREGKEAVAITIRQ